MHIRFATPDLRALDRLSCEALLLPFFGDERPFGGVLGLADWRLCGFLSRMRLAGRISGAVGERILIPGRPKLPMDKLILFGLGPERDFGPALLRDSLARMLETLTLARVRSTALVLPGRHRERIAPATAIEALTAVLLSRASRDEVVVIEPVDAQRDMAPVIERERRRARARAE